VKVAVTGATGYVGRFIVDRLASAGIELRAWRRPSSDLRGMPDGIEWIDGELGVPAAAEALLDGADMLVHAALDHLPGRYRGGEGSEIGSYIERNVGGSLALLVAARKLGVGRCVVLSSRAVFGEEIRSAAISDDELPRPDTHYGAAKAALEAFVRSFGREGWAISALRPTGVYGMVLPAERSKWFDLVARILRREPVKPRAGTEVHGADVAESVWRLLRADPADIAGRAFNCSDIVVSTRDIVQLVHRSAGISGPLPEQSPAPLNIMAHPGLDRLGMVFGGRAALEATVEELVRAVTSRDQEAIARTADAR
jgi:nucleoside-diphosphate-sugar epimerase